jgi:peptidyl-dipeptidase Dcp
MPKKLHLLISLLVLLMIPSFMTMSASPSDGNPFFAPYGTPFETPPFDRIKNEHFVPAFKQGMTEQKSEVDAIIAESASPTFQNTIEALERSGLFLDRVNNVFGALQGTSATDELRKIAEEVAPLLAKHRDDINLNEKLFTRVQAVYEKRKELTLTPEQVKLLDETYKGFIRGGAGLTAGKKDRFRAINEELSLLSLKFDENVLMETSSYKLVIDKGEDLAGLPQSSIDGAAAAAKKAGMEGKWVFTAQRASMTPFLQYAQNRALRERLFTAYVTRGDHGNSNDNKGVITKIAALRAERAQLLGFPTHADYMEERNMSKTPAAVNDLLKKIWTPALARAKQERDAMQAIIKKEGGNFALQPWDWWYYAEKVRKEQYDLDENALRPYFLLENVRNGAFEVARRLYGLEFTERKDITRYNDEVVVFEVKKNGAHVGILYTDYFPRPEKQQGAWCNVYRGQENGIRGMVTPLVTNNGNFSRPGAGKPALISPDEVRTLFHEFGHALQSLLQTQTYRTLGVPGDFVELPSQIMENWAFEPEVLKLYAHHYKTGEVIPQALVEKVTKSDAFNQGFITVEYLAACFLDMDWHSVSAAEKIDARDFEKKSLERIQLIPEIVVRYRSTFFSHIWGAGSGYDAGYYYYIWAAVLDADAFEAFKEKGIFDKATADAFGKFVLAKGATDDAMTQYEKFRGKKPGIEPLLKKRGLL